MKIDNEFLIPKVAYNNSKLIEGIKKLKDILEYLLHTITKIKFFCIDYQHYSRQLDDLIKEVEIIGQHYRSYTMHISIIYHRK